MQVYLQHKNQDHFYILNTWKSFAMEFTLNFSVQATAVKYHTPTQNDAL